MNENGAALLNALPHPVFTLDADNQFDLANAAAEVFFSTSSSVLKKRTLSHYIARNSPALALVEQVRTTLVPVNEYKVDLSSPRLGGERWMDIYVAPFGDEAGTLMVMLQVRTFAAALDNQLHHRGAARTVTGLAAMLGHEIKNPLSGIRGAAQLLEHSLEDDGRALTRLITEETDRIVRLVDRMEVFSNERPITRDQVNIHSVFDHVLNVARQGFARDVSIVELYDPSLPLVYGNRDQLIQVFLNLVKNACEAMHGASDRTLTMLTAFRPGIRIAAAGSTERVSLPISLTVRDTGPGVPDDIHDLMFDPFISSKQNGSGLGLALVAKIVGDHGGVISCSRDRQHTDFTVLLPAWSGGGNEQKGDADG